MEKYSGSGECFVFSLEPNPRKFTWTRTDDMLMLGGKDTMCIGGGSAPALWLNDDLTQGQTGMCETFGCPPLLGSSDPTMPADGQPPQVSFESATVEVYILIP
mmetsp:Transcript_57527/g.141058  ORF Transcript_57527/g.141058 Transcript_57527/m.141058 type:complete len:103 (-) Transcript_57527:361-669(-)